MSKIRILFLAADPTDSSRLRLGQELRDIREKLQLSKLRDNFLLEARESTRPGDITQAILDIEPQLVHFSGHGMSTGELCFEDILGKTQPVSPTALASLFELVAEQVNCVVLNACYSEVQAKAIAEHIPFVIGMNQAIGDRAAITFATGFYKALGAGRLFEDAYKFARVEIQLQGIPEHLTPVFFKAKQDKSRLEVYETQVNKIEPLSRDRILTSSTAQDLLDSSQDDKQVHESQSVSGNEVTYARLENLLRTGKWKEADDVTLTIMLKLARREREGWLDVQHVERLPCKDLQTLNQLWTTCSNGHFGFSVQKHIWEVVKKNCEIFGSRVGWRSSYSSTWKDYLDLTFDLSAPQGHLPSLSWRPFRYLLVDPFAARLSECGIQLSP
jgi:hypothetical protein